MKDFEYWNPVETVFGNDCIRQIGEKLSGKYKRYLLVSTRSSRKLGTYDKVKEQLQKAGGEVFEISPVPTNPKMTNVYEGVHMAAEKQADCVVALGGGSVMDCSKIIAMSAKTGIDARDYVWGDADKDTQSIDTVMIPTIAATGTELNNTAVVVDRDKREKFWCYAAFPKLCFMDPELTATLPEKMTIWGIMDVLSHTFEFYMNGDMDSEFQLQFSEGIIRTVMKCAEQLHEDPQNLLARGELLWSSTMTWGTGLTKIGRGEAEMSCHNIEERFSGFFDTHHGGGLGVITPRWMLHVYQKRPEIFARFARNVMGIQEEKTVECARLGIEKYCQWLKKIQAPSVYKDLNPELEFDKGQLDLVAEKIWKVCGRKVGKLVPLQIGDIKSILYAGNEPL